MASQATQSRKGNTMSKRITRSTIKSFVRKNRDNLLIKVKSSFNGMVDGVCDVQDDFDPIVSDDRDDCTSENTLGISGAWLTLSRGFGGDRYTAYSENGLQGYTISNCCGSFILAVRS